MLSYNDDYSNLPSYQDQAMGLGAVADAMAERTANLGLGHSTMGLRDVAGNWRSWASKGGEGIRGFGAAPQIYQGGNNWAQWMKDMPETRQFIPQSVQNYTQNWLSNGGFTGHPFLQSASRGNTSNFGSGGADQYTISGPAGVYDTYNRPAGISPGAGSIYDKHSRNYGGEAQYGTKFAQRLAQTPGMGLNPNMLSTGNQYAGGSSVFPIYNNGDFSTQRSGFIRGGDAHGAVARLGSFGGIEPRTPPAMPSPNTPQMPPPMQTIHGPMAEPRIPGWQTPQFDPNGGQSDWLPDWGFKIPQGGGQQQPQQSAQRPQYKPLNRKDDLRTMGPKERDAINEYLKPDPFLQGGMSRKDYDADMYESDWASFVHDMQTGALPPGSKFGASQDPQRFTENKGNPQFDAIAKMEQDFLDKKDFTNKSEKIKQQQIADAYAYAQKRLKQLVNQGAFDFPGDALTTQYPQIARRMPTLYNYDVAPLPQAPQRSAFAPATQAFGGHRIVGPYGGHAPQQRFYSTPRYYRGF